MRSRKRDHGLLVLMLAVLGLLGWLVLRVPAISIPSTPVKATRHLPESHRQAALQALDKLPLYFIENRGQLDPQVAYYVQGRDTSVYFGAQGVTFALTGRGGSQGAPDARLHPASWSGVGFTRPPKPAAATQRWAVKLDFLGANPDAEPAGEDPTPAVISYFKGRPGDWKAGLPTYSKLVYADLWPGIDLVYSGTVNRLKYTFVVKPGASPEQIKLAYRGITALMVNDAGELEVLAPGGGFQDGKPYAYQETEGGQREIAASYDLEAKQEAETQVYGFRVGGYDRSRPLFLDPVVLVYAGYIGGSALETISQIGVGIAVDTAGNAYITGQTSSSEASFPVIVGPDLTFNGGFDAFVAKVNATGTALVYAGYIGGSGDDFGAGIAVDTSGNAYVTGQTSSSEVSFPVTVGPDLTFNGGSDAFVAKLNASGTALVYAGYIGGSGDDFGAGIAVDTSGNAYVTGMSRSSEATFPVTVGPDLTFNGGSTDAFVAKVNAAGTALVYAGYIGGSGFDFGRGIAVDGTGNAYVTGETASSEATFLVTVGPDLTYNGGTDAFVGKVNAAGTALVYAGYIGGSGDDAGQGIAVDRAGSAYVTGVTTSPEASFPVSLGPDLTFNGASDAFVAKVNAAGSALVYAGYIGGSLDDRGDGIAVDAAGNAYVTGTTSSSEVTFPVRVGPGLTYKGFGDAFVAKVNAAGAVLVYAGYIGGSDIDFGLGIAVDRLGNAYVTGVTGSSEASFPITVGPDLTHNGILDSFVAKISETPSGGCPPHTVHGHISTVPASHSGNVSHQHHGQHGHTAAANCPPHVPGHSAALLPELEEAGPIFTTGAPRARRGALLQLFGSAEGLYLGDQDDRPVLGAGGFLPPASGSPLYYTASLPQVRIGGAVARVLFSGLAPGLRGVWQINVVVPGQATLGKAALTISYEGIELKQTYLVVE